jgi:hypothetical protein
MIRVKSVDEVRPPTNDNMAVANDNKRTDYMARYMRRRRHGGKTLKQLLRDGLACIERAAPQDDPEAQAFIAAVHALLEPKEPAKRGEA